MISMQYLIDMTTLISIALIILKNINGCIYDRYNIESISDAIMRNEDIVSR
jgi:hypothetical protein